MATVSRSPAVADRSAREGPGLVPSLTGWAGRSGVEQVELYTRWTLYVVVWLLLAMGALSALNVVPGTEQATALVALCVGCGVVLTLITRRAMAGNPVSWGLLGALAALAAVLAVWGSTLPAEPGAVLGVLGGGALGWAAGTTAERPVQWSLVALAAVLCWLASGSVFAAAYGTAVALFFTFTVVSSLWLLRVVTELDQARGTQTALAVAEERLRFSRDVHDVLGRQLSVIAVQSELAATLARRGDARAAEKILEVRSTAHDALREARELARGYRPLDLTHELDGAVSLLRSAGIEASADLTGLPEAWHEPVARVVREAVTNVLRHSDARRVSIRYADDAVVVSDDGTPRAEGRRVTGSGDGTGLATLREDLGVLGAGLEAGPTGQGFEVRLRLRDRAPREGER